MLLFLILLSWFLALGAAIILRKTVIKGEQTPFVMEMPPYHAPNFHSVFSTAGTRCWQYVQKAGTIILGVNVVMWAIMYFPQQDQSQFYGERRQAAADMLNNADLSEDYQNFFSQENIDQTRAYLARCYKVTQSKTDVSAMKTEFRKEALDATPSPAVLAEAVLLPDKPYTTDTSPSEGDILSGNVDMTNAESDIPYIDFRHRMQSIDQRAAAKQLRHSFAGILGRTVTPVTRLAGFDWKTNIALIGGFAAKEIIVSTLGSVYSLSTGNGEELEPPAGNAQEDSRLVQEIRADWTPLRAFTLMIFVMVYAPCVVTITVLGREAGHWKWALFSTAYNTILGFCLAVLVYQAGAALGIGT